MAENLRTTKYRDGSDIPEIVRSESWNSLTEGAYCNYSNAKGVDTIATYGRLYNWHAINDSRNLAPAGWHVPSDTEWFQLTDYLGGLSVAGGKLKEKGTLHWKNPNEAATNETGFTALPDGSRNYGGPFMDKGNYGYLWSTTETADGFAWYRAWSYDHSAVSRSNYYKTQGFSVRCVKD